MRETPTTSCWWRPGPASVPRRRWARALRECRRRGEAEAARAERDPAARLGALGSFGPSSRRELAVRRLLLAARVPPEAVALLGMLWPGRRQRERWFGLARRLAFWAGVRRRLSREHWTSLTRGVPVLVYHAFTDTDPSGRYVLSGRAFARQLWTLRALRFRPLGFEELASVLAQGRLPPGRTVVITLDDGYADNLEVACPILRRHGFTATIFLVSGRLGATNDWARDPLLRGRPLLAPGQLSRLREAGLGFGAHTRTHPALPELSDGRLQEEVAGGRAELGRELGAAPTTFAYPYGRFDERAVAAVRAAGFVGAATTEPRLVWPADDPALIPRIEIRGDDSLARFLLKLWLGPG